MASRPNKKLSFKAKAWTGVAVLCLLLVAAIVLAVYFATRSQACPKETCQSSCKASWDASTNSCVNDVSACQSTCQGNWDAANNVCKNTVSQDCKDLCKDYGLVWKDSATTPVSGACAVDFTTITGPTGEFTSGSKPVCVASNKACQANTDYEESSNTCASTVKCQDSCQSYGVQWESSSSSCAVDFDKLKGSTGEFTSGSTPVCEASSATCQGGEFNQSTHVCQAGTQGKVTQAQCAAMPRTYWDTILDECRGSCSECEQLGKTTTDPTTWVSCGDRGCMGSLVINKNVGCTNASDSVGYQPSLDATLDAIKARAPSPGDNNAYAIGLYVDPTKTASQSYHMCHQTAIGCNSFTETTVSDGYGVVLNPFGGVYTTPSSAPVCPAPL